MEHPLVQLYPMDRVSAKNLNDLNNVNLFRNSKISNIMNIIII